MRGKPASWYQAKIDLVETCVWTLINTDIKHNRLSHTSTQVGSYLFVIGGHNGQAYAQDVLLFNLGKIIFTVSLPHPRHRVRGAYGILTVSAVTLQWEVKLPRGIFPPAGDIT